jgi:hypothetical protein
MKSTILALAGASMLVAAAPASAHHSYAMFDREKTVTLVGTIKEFQWTNPHSWIQIEVTDDKGVATEWSIESLSTGTLSRMGWRPSTFQPGDKVTVVIWPMKDGSPGGSFDGAILANGQPLGNVQTLTLGANGKPIDKAIGATGK